MIVHDKLKFKLPEGSIETSTTLTSVDVPAQDKAFIVENTINYGAGGVDDTFHWWFRANNNVFSSLDFSSGISTFYAGSIGEWGSVSQWQHFRIDFTDGSYIYLQNNYGSCELVYRDGAAGTEKQFNTSTGLRDIGNSWVVAAGNVANDYVKTFISMGPSGFNMGVQSSISEGATQSGSLTSVNGADWTDLDFTGKTISDTQLFKLSTNNASRNRHDIACFAIGEVFPTTFPRTKKDRTGTDISGGTVAIEDAFKLTYDRYFLFGNGDNDVLVGSNNYFYRDANATFTLKSHGDSGAVTLSIIGKYFDGPLTVYPNDLTHNSLAITQEFFWTGATYGASNPTAIDLTNTNYYNEEFTVNREGEAQIVGAEIGESILLPIRAEHLILEVDLTSGASVELQMSADNVNWFPIPGMVLNVASAKSITKNNHILQYIRPIYRSDGIGTISKCDIHFTYSS